MTNDEQRTTELRVLAYMINGKDYVATATTKLREDEFMHGGTMFRMVRDYFMVYGDVPTASALTTMSRKLDADARTAFRTMFREVNAVAIVNDGDLRFTCDQLIASYKRRKCLQVASRIIDANPRACSDDDLVELQGDVFRTMADIASADTENQLEGFVDADVDERLARYEQVKTNPDDVNLIRSGFRTFDEANGGFKPGELIYVIGRKGDGKSVFLIHIAHAAWLQGKNVLLFSLEIPKADYERRFDARAAQVDSDGLKRGTLSPKDEDAYRHYLENLKLGRSPAGDPVGRVYIIDAPGKVTPTMVATKIDELERKHGIVFDVVITDYAGIMAPNIASGVKRDDMTSISLDQKRIARAKHKVYFSAAQMNRLGRQESSTAHGATDTAHIADSDGIGDNLDVLFSIRSTSDDEGIIETPKVRDGKHVRFHFEKAFGKMMIIERDDSGWGNEDD